MADGGIVRDKVVLVTGVGRGIGRAFAVMMAAEGAKVVVNDLGGTSKGEGADQEPALEVVKEIEDAGGEAVANFDVPTCGPWDRLSSCSRSSPRWCSFASARPYWNLSASS